MTQRLSVNINDECAEALYELAVRESVTATEVIRRAISVYKFVSDEQDAGKQLKMVFPGEAA